jgi:hypothetical protein
MVFQVVADFSFGEAHWFLAHKYLRVAKNMPKILDGAGDEVQPYRRLLWIGIISNIALPLLQMPFWVWGWYDLLYNQIIEAVFPIAYTITKSLTQLAWVASAAVLIWSIIRIRSELSARNAEDSSLNLQSLIVHSGAFGLFAVSVLINLGFFMPQPLDCFAKRDGDKCD